MSIVQSTLHRNPHEVQCKMKHLSVLSAHAINTLWKGPSIGSPPLHRTCDKVIGASVDNRAGSNVFFTEPKYMSLDENSSDKLGSPLVYMSLYITKRLQCFRHYSIEW